GAHPRAGQLLERTVAIADQHREVGPLVAEQPRHFGAERARRPGHQDHGSLLPARRAWLNRPQNGDARRLPKERRASRPISRGETGSVVVAAVAAVAAAAAGPASPTGTRAARI